MVYNILFTILHKKAIQDNRYITCNLSKIYPPPQIWDFFPMVYNMAIETFWTQSVFSTSKRLCISDYFLV